MTLRIPRPSVTSFIEPRAHDAVCRQLGDRDASLGTQLVPPTFPAFGRDLTRAETSAKYLVGKPAAIHRGSRPRRPDQQLNARDGAKSALAASNAKKVEVGLAAHPFNRLSGKVARKPANAQRAASLRPRPLGRDFSVTRPPQFTESSNVVQPPCVLRRGQPLRQRRFSQNATRGNLPRILARQLTSQHCASDKRRRSVARSRFATHQNPAGIRR